MYISQEDQKQLISLGFLKEQESVFSKQWNNDQLIIIHRDILGDSDFQISYVRPNNIESRLIRRCATIEEVKIVLNEIKAL